MGGVGERDDPDGGATAFDPGRVLEHLPDGVVVFDAAVDLVWVNRRFCQLTGWTPGEVIGRNGLELVDPEQLAAALDALTIVTETPHLLPPGAYRLRCADGSLANFELHAAPIDPADPRSLTAMMVRPVDYQVVVRDGMEILNAGGPVEDVARYVVHEIGWEAGDVAVVFDRDADGERTAVHNGLPELLAGVTKPVDGLGPWNEAEASGEAVHRSLDELPPSVAAAAHAAGFVSCTAEVVPDPAGRDALVLLWFRVDAPSTYRFLFRDEPRYLLLRLALERRAYQQSLHRAATIDDLTGLANRPSFFHAVEHGPSGPCTVLYLDLDDFKPVNDGLGHLAGDAVLAEVGRRLRDNVRDVDLAARVGGDEFAVWCPDLGDVDEAASLAERLHAALTLPVALPGGSAEVGASLGVAVSTGGVTGAEDLVGSADEQLYEVKRTGKGGFRLVAVP